jgi:2,3-dihydroxybenzoate-AMP ligase
LPACAGKTDFVPIAAAIQRACPELRQVIVHGDAGSLPHGFTSLEALRASSFDTPLQRSSPSAAEVALLQLSGGSTGIPKLIARTHDDYLYSVRRSAELCELGTETRYLAVLPITHNFTLSSPGVLGTLHAGGTVVVAQNPSAEHVLDSIERERITLLSAVPSLVYAWAEAKARFRPEKRYPALTLQVGGAKLDAALARRVQRDWGGRLQQVFGMAEGLVNYTRLDAPAEVIATTQGRPLSPFDEIRVVDPSDPEGPRLLAGAVGELQTRGPYTIRGYFDDRANDARHFTRDGFYRTGDLVRVTASGDLTVEGRLGQRILRAGEKISPEEVEQQLRTHPDVFDVALIGVPDTHLGERSHAFVMLHVNRPQPTLATLRGHLRERGMAEFKLPDVVHVIEKLPRTGVGKIDRNALLAWFAESRRGAGAATAKLDHHKGGP